MSAQEIDTQHPFGFLAPHDFVVLTTYRKDGTPVPTTIWFAYEDGRVYATTSNTAGKIKRIRATGRVAMTPSDRIGTLLGEPEVAGVGRDTTTEERPAARAALERKYGEQFQKIAGAETPDRAYIIIEPATR